MIRQNFLRRGVLPAAAILYLALMPQRMHAGSGYIQHNLASDVPLLADYTDPNLVNPWGLALSPFWVCNNRTGTYDVNSADGTPTATVTIVPPAPGKTGTGRCTGAARNNNPAAFQVSPGVNGTWLLDTEDGLITIRSGAQNIIKVDNSGSGAVYKGLALRNTPDYIYAANFNSGKIEVYDGNWAAATLPGTFTDPQVPAGYAPFNIQNIGGKLYVAYAKQDSAKQSDVAGQGNGYVAIFDTNGNLLQHVISNGQLNSPWGVAVAPASFGPFANDLLVGNFGDGLINAFDPSTGKFLGTLQDPSGNPIVNVGLWALEFGGGGSGGFPNTLYITAGISAGEGIQNHGLLAAIYTTAPPAVTASGVVNNASFAAGALAPGSIAAIFGANLTEGVSSCLAPACSPTFRSDKRLNATLAGAQVTINGIPVPILYASPVQLGVQIPTDVLGTSASLQVTVAGQSSPPIPIPIGAFSPGIYFAGAGVGAITHANGTPVNAANQATPGEMVTIYANGLGQVTPAVPTGALPPATPPTPTVTTPTVSIDGIQAQVQFSGLAACCVGLNQLNVVVPSNVNTGGSVAVTVSIGGQQSNTVNMPTKAP